MAFADDIAKDVEQAAKTGRLQQQQDLTQRADEVTRQLMALLREAVSGLERGLHDAGFRSVSHVFEEKERWDAGHARSITLQVSTAQTRKPLEFVFGVTQQAGKKRSEGYVLKVIGSNQTLGPADLIGDNLREFVRQEIREQLRDQIDNKLLHQP